MLSHAHYYWKLAKENTHWLPLDAVRILLKNVFQRIGSDIEAMWLLMQR